MGTLEIIRKFIGSNYVLDRIAKEIFDRLPLRLRYRVYYGKTFLFWSAFLKESEFWDKEKLEDFQFEQLKALLEHAALNVPYYKKLFSDYGFNPKKVQCLEDVKTLPYLTKETVREKVNDFVATNIHQKELIKATTSGSAGIPLTVYKTREVIEIFHAFQFDLLSGVGFNPGKKTVIFQWKDISMGKKKGLNFLRYGNKLILSAAQGNMNNEWMQKYYAMIWTFRPQFISGYVTIILAMAFFIKEQGLYPFNCMKAVFAHSEAIYPWQRRIIEESFGADVFPSYGMHEGVVFGGGCEHTNQYHIYPQYGVTEFIDINGNKNNHEIVGTGFGNYAMPFIRYRTMDIGVKGAKTCSICSRHYPLIESIDGRSYDFLVNKKGQLFPSIISVDSTSFKNVKQFQFYQDEPGIACLRIVKRKSYSNADTVLLENEINKQFSIPGKGIEIKILFVNDIKTTSSGKSLRTDQRLNIKDFAF